MIVIGYLGWIIYSSLFLLKTYSSLSDDKIGKNRASSKEPFSKIIQRAFFGTSLLFGIYLMLKRSPYLYYLYVGFPLYFWHNICQDYVVLGKIRKSISLLSLGKIFIIYFGGLEFVVFSFFCREVLSIGLWIACLWPFTWNLHFRNNNRIYEVLWFFCCILLSIFPFMPADKLQNVYFLNVGTLFVVIVGLCGLLYSRYQHQNLYGSFENMNLITPIFMVFFT